MPLPQLIAKTPQVIPATEAQTITEIIPAAEEKIYNKYWITQLSIISPSTTEDAKMIAVLVPARDVEVNGEIIKELMPNAENTTIVIHNLFERMAMNETLAITMASVLNEVIKIGQEQGVLEK